MNDRATYRDALCKLYNHQQQEVAPWIITKRIYDVERPLDPFFPMIAIILNQPNFPRFLKW